jgi:hypothetical protein
MIPNFRTLSISPSLPRCAMVCLGNITANLEDVKKRPLASYCALSGFCNFLTLIVFIRAEGVVEAPQQPH